MFESLYWDDVQYNGLSFTLVVCEKGLCFVRLPNQSSESIVEWIQYYAPESELVYDSRRVTAYAKQLREYLEGHLKTFDIPMDLRGTTFQQNVWQALCTIPFGETRTYGQMAESLGKPAAVRAVGVAIGTNPVPIFIPCHRVIGKSGKLTGYRGGLELKASLLDMEAKMLASS